MPDTVSVHCDGQIALMTLNRPERLNAINQQVIRDFRSAAHDLSERRDIRVVLLRGEGRAFCTGHDLVDEEEGPSPTELYSVVREIPHVTIALIHGACVAGGAGIALSCDLRVAVRDSFFAWPQARRGIMSVSGPVILGRLVPPNIACELLFTGERLCAEEALRWGIVNLVVDSNELLDAGIAMAKRVLASAPIAVRSIKDALYHAQAVGVREAEAFARSLSAMVNASEDAVEGKQSFKEKREPVWQGR